MPKIPSEELQEIKDKLKNFRCAHCESDKLEIPDARIQSIVPSFGGTSFEGFIIACKNCQNSSYYDLERDCFGMGVSHLDLQAR